MTWSDEQFAKYRKDGYLFVRGLLGPRDLGALNETLPELLAGDEARDGMHREREKSGAVRQVYSADRHSPPFRALVRRPEILGPVRALTGNEVYVWHSKINVKDSFEGAVWLWHQDYGYWMWDGVEPKLTSVMVLLDRATVNNGCLMVVAGSHAWGRQEHFADTVTTSYKQWCVDVPTLRRRVREEDIRHIAGEPGDVLFFDCNLLHGSGHNMSPLPRKTFIVCYNDVANTPRPVEQPRPDWVVSRAYEAVRLEPAAT
ncbi:MAG: phytanoyl-CoA dioxygenase family protein [Planctomycetota bacterium]|nr:phytanoyl-CoA dioxygenase family protein [Planctomycetota bacterium]